MAGAARAAHQDADPQQPCAPAPYPGGRKEAHLLVDRTLVGVGSLNAAKAGAARAVLGRLARTFEVVAVEVKAAVGDNPVGDEDTRRGAEQRARGVLALGGYELGIGMEGGIAVTTEGPFLMGWCAVCDRYGRLSLAAGARVPLPPTAAERVARGEEAGPVMEDLAGDPELERRGGAIGYLTAGLVPRQLQWELALAAALAPWFRLRLYGWDERLVLRAALAQPSTSRGSD